jgi:hypothetical protein
MGPNARTESRAPPTAQPYKDIERADKLISFPVNPGVLPIVKAISMDTCWRKMLRQNRSTALLLVNSTIPSRFRFRCAQQNCALPE